MPNEICVFGQQNVRNDLFLKPSMKTKYLRLSEHNYYFIFLVLSALQTDDLNLYRLASSCLFDIMQFQQHDAINETLISTTIFWHKSKVFVEMNSPLSSENFYNKISFFIE